jgi:hypothetical protein
MKIWISVWFEALGVAYSIYFTAFTILGITVVSYFAWLCLGYPIERIRKRFKKLPT